MTSIVLQSIKKASLIFFLAALFAMPTWTEPWGGIIGTVAAGTAARITTRPTLASSLFFQMQTGGTGRGYVLYAPPDVVCHNGGAGTTLIAELQPATSTAPGGNAVIPSNPDPQGVIDISGYCYDGSHTGDTVIISWNIRN